MSPHLPARSRSRLATRLACLLRAHPRLFASAAAGLALALLLPTAWVPRGVTRGLLGWNLFALTYLGLGAHLVWRATPEDLARRAARQDDGRAVVLGLGVLASVAVLVAVGSQLSAARELAGSARLGHFGLAMLTAASAWCVTQLLFALHYAHAYVAVLREGHPPPLQFPGDEPPGYTDFLYMACVIGTSGQTADVALASRAMRRVGLVHCVQAFFFNTTVLALTINIAAGLF